MNTVYYGMVGVDSLLIDLLTNGVWIPNERTGTKTKAIFDAKIVIREDEFPFVTNMLASPRLAFEEMWFFLNGRTNTKELEKNGVNFWKGNTSREFLDKNGFEYLDEGELGAAYSNQWRNFGGYDENYANRTGKSGIDSNGIDQLRELVENLKKDKYSRRHLVTLWNPEENPFGVLTPCWYTSQYVVLPNNKGEDVLHVKLINRSLDTVFGARFAIMQYRIFQMALCKMFGFKLGKLSCDLSHIHIYENQIDYANELLTRSYIKANNELTINKDISDLNDLLDLQWADFDLEYTYNKEKFKTPRPKMVE